MNKPEALARRLSQLSADKKKSETRRNVGDCRWRPMHGRVYRANDRRACEPRQWSAYSKSGDAAQRNPFRARLNGGGYDLPAVRVGFSGSQPFSFVANIIPYIVFQVAGAICAAAVLKIVAEGHPGFVLGGFASNGFGELSPGHYNLLSCAIIEIVLSFFFILVILGVTSVGAPVGFAALAIGLTLTLIHLISIPVTNTSVNPARSTARRFSPAKPISSSSGSSGSRRSRAPKRRKRLGDRHSHEWDNRHDSSRLHGSRAA